jgi:hypothetical protein
VENKTFVDYTLKDSFTEHYDIGQNVSIDEHMVKGKGWNPFKQYMPQKPIKRGTKIWELGCACCAYLYDFQIYAGARGTLKKDCHIVYKIRQKPNRITTPCNDDDDVHHISVIAIMLCTLITFLPPSTSSSS